MTLRLRDALRVGLFLLVATSSQGLAQQHSSPPSDSKEDKDRMKPCPDFGIARRVLLRAENDEDRILAFETLAAHVPHTGGANTLSEEEWRQFRDKEYATVAPLLETLGLLQVIVKDPKHTDVPAVTEAAAILADRGGPENLALLLEGIHQRPEDSKVLPGIARHLGRGCKDLVDAGKKEPIVRHTFETLYRLRDSLAPSSLGASIEGLYRAGDVLEARASLESLMSSEASPVEVLPILFTCRGLLRHPDMDPEMADHADAMATSATKAILESERESRQLVSAAGELYRDSVNFLISDGAKNLDALLHCYQHPTSPRLLGIDGVQRIRVALMKARKGLTDEKRMALDDLFVSALLDMGERLFSLEEEPMDEDERREFLFSRDLRYNATEYVTTLWEEEGNEEFQQSLIDNPDAVEFLSLIVAATEDEEEDGLFFRVAEKLETRINSARILALMEQKGVDSGMDLAEYFVEMLADEVQATKEEVMASFDKFRELDSGYFVLRIPQIVKPEDLYVKHALLSGLYDVGYDVYQYVDGATMLANPKVAEEDSKTEVASG